MNRLFDGGQDQKGFTDFPLYHTEGNVLVCYGELSFILFQLVGPESRRFKPCMAPVSLS